VLDYGSDLEVSQRMLGADHLDCVSSKEMVRIQFVLDGVETLSFEGRDAFSSRLPVTLVRLQRREDFRLATPLANPIICEIPIPKGSGAHQSVNATLVDISGGGIGLINVPPDESALKVGAEFPDVHFNLPKIGAVTATMRILYTYTVPLPSGKIQQRAGCQFVKLPGPMIKMIRRYIIQVERERKSREMPTRALA
jgi:flagellar brake protein